MIDILQKIANGEISEEKAHDILDEVIERFHNGELDSNPKEELNLDNYEWTALGHTAGLEILAKWRYHGWPKKCSKCGAKIDYKKYGWIIRDDKLIGLNCHTFD